MMMTELFAPCRRCLPALLAAGLCLGAIPAVAQTPFGAPGFGENEEETDSGGLADALGAAVDAIFPAIDFSAFLPPKVGYSYIDPLFGTLIKRISDAPNTTDNASGKALPLITHEYATVSPFNIDNTRLLVQHFTYFALYDGNGNYLRDLPFEINSASEPRWSRDDPDVFYYLTGNQLKSYDIGTGRREVVREFPEYRDVSGLGESDLSGDGDRRVLVGDRRQIFVYDLALDRKRPALTIPPDVGIDNVLISPRNRVLVGWLRSGSTRFSGVEMFDENMNFIAQLTPVVAHMDVGSDDNGDDVLLWHNSADPNPPSDCQNAVMKIRLRDRRKTCLISFEWGVGVHISAVANSDHFVISTYSALDAAEKAGRSGLLKYQDEILRLSYDGKQVERMAHHWSGAYDTYVFQPKASLSQDGSRLVFSSNYRQQEKKGYSDRYTDAFLMCVESCSLQSGEGGEESGWIWSERYKMLVFREQEDSPDARFDGSWHLMHHTNLSEGSVRISNTEGDRMEYRFEGSGISWIGYTGPFAGSAEVFIDGESRAVVDGFGSRHRMKAEVFAVRDLEPGEHTLAIEVLDAGAGTWVWVDAFDTRPYTPSEDDV